MNKKLTMVAFGAIAVGSAICTTDAHAADEDLVLKSDNNGAISEQDVASKKQEYEKAQDKVKQAKSELDAKVQKAKDVEKQVQDTNKKIQNTSDANQNLKQNEQKAKELESKKVQAQKDLGAKQDALKQAQNNEKAKEKALADKQKQKDTTKKEEAKITEKVSELTKQKSDTQPLTTKVKSLENASKQAELDVNNKQKAVDDEKALAYKTSGDRSQFTIAKKNAEDKLVKLRNDLQTLTNQESALKKSIDSVQPNPFGIKGIKLSAELDSNFVLALQDHLADPNNTTKLARAVAAEKKVRPEPHGPSINPYIYADDALVDVANLSESDKLKLSQYFTMLNNQIRAQFGKAPQKVNKNVQTFATDVALETMKDGFSKPTHYHRAINKVAYKLGIDKEDKGELYNRFESIDFSFTKNQGTKISMRQLYDNIYRSLFRFYYEGQMNNHYMHASHLLEDVDTTAVAFSIVKDSRVDSFGLSQLRFSVYSINKWLMHDGWRREGNNYVGNFDRYNNLYGASSNANIKPIGKIIEDPTLDEKVAKLKELTSDITRIKNNIRDEEYVVKHATTELNKLGEVHVEEKEKALKLSKEEKYRIDNELTHARTELTALLHTIDQINPEIDKLDEQKQNVLKRLAVIENELIIAKDEFAKARENVIAATKDVELAVNTVNNVDKELGVLRKSGSELRLHRDNVEVLHAQKQALLAELHSINVDVTKLQADLKVLSQDVINKYSSYSELKAQRESKTVYHSTVKYAPIHELPEFTEPIVTHMVPDTAPVVDALPELKIPEVKFSVPKDAPVLELPELKIPEVKFSVPKDAPVLELPEFKESIVKYATAKDAPVHEVPEFDLDGYLRSQKSNVEDIVHKLQQPKEEHKQNVESTYKVAPEKKAHVYHKLTGKRLPNTGDNDAYGLLGTILTLLGVGLTKRRI